MLYTLAILNFILAVFDAWLTRRRVNEYGIKIELSGGIRKLMTLLGVEFGIFCGIMIPLAAFTILFLALKSSTAFALMVGFRVKLFVNQIQSFVFESELKRLTKELNSRGQQSGTTLLPPSSDGETPKDSKDDDEKSTKS